MTNTTLTWIGIVSQSIPAITAILMVTVGNFFDKKRERERYKLLEREYNDYLSSDWTNWCNTILPNKETTKQQ